MRLIAVYGSLLSGLHNHDVLGDSPLMYVGTFKGTMYSLGGFPGVKLEGDTDIKCEVYRVNDSTLARLDRLEGHPSFYRRTPITVSLDSGEEVEAEVYDWQGAPRNNNLVKNGDWRHYNLQSYR